MFDWLSSDATIKFVESLESAIIIVGAIIGSSWAVFTFIAQRRNWLVKKQPLIKLNLRVEQRWLPDDPSFYLHIIVEATNDGNVVDYMHYSGDDHLSVTRYHIDAKGERVSTEKIVRVLESTKGRKVNFNTLLPGSTVELPFWVRVTDPGLFHIRFYFLPNEQQLNAMKKAGHTLSGSSVVVSANKYYVVKPLEQCMAENA